MASITPTNTVPPTGTRPTDSSLAGKVVHFELTGNCLEIVGTVDAGSGRAYVLVFVPTAAAGVGAWYRLRCDGSGTGGFQVDSTADGGQVHATFAVPQRECVDFMILLPMGVTVTELFLTTRTI